MKPRHIDYIMYILIFIMVGLPLLFPLGLPVIISPEVRGLYDAINELPEGAVIVIDITYEPGNEVESWPQTKAIVQHAMSRPLKIVLVTLTAPGGVMYSLRAMEVVDKFGKEYGEDYVYLGFFPGLEAAFTSLVQDIHLLAKTDYYGTPIDQIPMMKNIKTGEDWDLFVTIVTHYYTSYIGLIQAPLEDTSKFAMAVVSISGPAVRPYYQSNQLVGLLSGMRGAAEYEALIDYPYWGVSLMDAVSMASLLSVLFIVAGNIVMVRERKKKMGGGV